MQALSVQEDCSSHQPAAHISQAQRLGWHSTSSWDPTPPHPGAQAQRQKEADMRAMDKAHDSTKQLLDNARQVMAAQRVLPDPLP